MKSFARTTRYRSLHGRAEHAPLPSLIPSNAASTGWVRSMRKSVSSLRQRRQLRHLLAYDDRTLLDMGHSRTQILHALHGRRARPATITAVRSIHLQDLHPEKRHTRH